MPGNKELDQNVTKEFKSWFMDTLKELSARAYSQNLTLSFSGGTSADTFEITLCKLNGESRYLPIFISGTPPGITIKSGIDFLIKVTSLFLDEWERSVRTKAFSFNGDVDVAVSFEGKNLV